MKQESTIRQAGFYGLLVALGAAVLFHGLAALTGAYPAVARFGGAAWGFLLTGVHHHAAPPAPPAGPPGRARPRRAPAGGGGRGSSCSREPPRPRGPPPGMVMIHVSRK